MPSHFESTREVQKNVMEEERKEGGTSGGLGSSSKSRMPLPFFNLREVQKFGSKGPKKPEAYVVIDLRFSKKP